jgi:phosphoglycolate phosphatase
MMAIKAVLFDKDGTLIDVNGTWVPFYKAMLKQEQGLSSAEVEAKMVATGLDPVTHTFRAGSTLAGGTTRQLVEQWWPDATPSEHASITYRLDHDYGDLALSHITPLMPLAHVLRELQTLGFKLGVATNDGEISAKRHLRSLKVDHFFAAILGADSVDVPKPSGQMVRLFAERAGLRPDEIAMVGDNSHDIEEARNGGAGLAIGVLTGNAERHHLEHEADLVLGSIAELADFFRGR